MKMSANADLSVNLDKTKIMIFKNYGKSLNNYLFRYGPDELHGKRQILQISWTHNESVWKL